MWLGVAIDHKLRFKPHALQVAKKAAAQVTTRAAVESQVHLLGGGECDKSVVGPYLALRYVPGSPAGGGGGGKDCS